MVLAALDERAHDGLADGSAAQQPHLDGLAVGHADGHHTSRAIRSS